MYKARTNYRKQQDARLAQLETERPELEQALAAARAEAEGWKARYEDLKQRALKAYYAQQEEIVSLRKQLGIEPEGKE
ncbi:MAG: hypothetical protein UDK36_05495 [Bacteroidaceae bacterium]|nr:hypothetical protein [Bacteroidaceae bacterium]